MYTVCTCTLNFPNFWQKLYTLVLVRVAISMLMNKCLAHHSSYPELSECDSYSLHKLQMTDLTLKAEQRSAMEAIYNHEDVFVWLPTGYGKSLYYQVLPFVIDYKHGVVRDVMTDWCW